MGLQPLFFAGTAYTGQALARKGHVVRTILSGGEEVHRWMYSGDATDEWEATNEDINEDLLNGIWAILPRVCSCFDGAYRSQDDLVDHPKCRGRGWTYPPIPEWWLPEWKENLFTPEEAERAWQRHLHRYWRAAGWWRG